MTATPRAGDRDTGFLAIITENPASDSRISVRVRSEDGAVVDSTGKSVDRTGNTVTGEHMGTQTGAARSGTQMGQMGTQNTGARMGTDNGNNVVTQFPLVRNNGWTAGNYTVDIWLYDRHAETKTFSVPR